MNKADREKTWFRQDGTLMCAGCTGDGVKMYKHKPYCMKCFKEVKK